MTIEKKKLYSYTEVTTSALADKIPTLQGGVNKVTTLQKIYNLFKNSFDSVYTTTSAVATQISNALTGYATQTFATSAANTAASARILKQDIQIFDIDASGINELPLASCVLSITNITGGTGNKEIKIGLDSGVWANGDIVSLIVLYKGFDVNLRSSSIYEELGVLYLSLYINVHSSPTEPVLIAINKIN